MTSGRDNTELFSVIGVHLLIRGHHPYLFSATIPDVVKGALTLAFASSSHAEELPVDYCKDPTIAVDWEKQLIDPVVVKLYVLRFQPVSKSK